jgi:hypothetical protein
MWRIEAEGRVYGPYSFAQMTEFAAQGRLSAASRVSDQADGGFRRAREVAQLQPLFAATQIKAQAPAPALAPSPTAAPEEANVLVFVEAHTLSHDALEDTLASLGLAVPVAQGLWLMRTRHTSSVIRNMVSQKLKAGDRLFVLDATRDKLAWFNLGPVADVRVREVWNAALPKEAA